MREKRSCFSPGRLRAARLPALRSVVQLGPKPCPGALSFDEVMDRGNRAVRTRLDAISASLNPDDAINIQFTSGTTGRSKGVLCAHRQSLSAPAAWAECGRVSSSDRYLCINPFFHNFGYKAGILACLQPGATLIPQLTFDPDIWDQDMTRITRQFGGGKLGLHGAPNMTLNRVTVQGGKAFLTRRHDARVPACLKSVPPFAFKSAMPRPPFHSPMQAVAWFH